MQWWTFVRYLICQITWNLIFLSGYFIQNSLSIDLPEAVLYYDTQYIHIVIKMYIVMEYFIYLAQPY